ncbi:MAG: hypothetical protein AB4426_00705 [Xenococcaceae cyanobacterium]
MITYHLFFVNPYFLTDTLAVSNLGTDYQNNYQALYSQMRSRQVHLVFIGRIQSSAR